MAAAVRMKVALRKPRALGRVSGFFSCAPSMGALLASGASWLGGLLACQHGCRCRGWFWLVHCAVCPHLMSKSGKARHVPLSGAVVEILSSLPRWPKCPYVVPNPETLEPFVNVHYSWNTARVKAMLPEVRMHDLRHSMASNLVNSGRSIYEVSKILGHSQLKTSERYAHLAHETLLAAADAASNDWRRGA